MQIFSWALGFCGVFAVTGEYSCDSVRRVVRVAMDVLHALHASFGRSARDVPIALEYVDPVRLEPLGIWLPMQDSVF